MIIGVDISQIVFKGTGVGRYVEEMVRSLLKDDKRNQYVLFGASLRKRAAFYQFFSSLHEAENVTLKVFPIPPKFLELIWNQLHILPIEWFLGRLDIFWSSDWTQPPLSKAKGITTIHDLTIFRFPESFAMEITTVHRRKLERSKIICSFFLCDSEATKSDAHTLLNIPLEKLTVVYPGYNIQT